MLNRPVIDSDNGIVYNLEKYHVPYVLAGSVRPISTVSIFPSFRKEIPPLPDARQRGYLYF